MTAVADRIQALVIEHRHTPVDVRVMTICTCGEPYAVQGSEGGPGGYDQYAAHLGEVTEEALKVEEIEVWAVRYGDGETAGTWTKPQPARRYVTEIRKEIKDGEYQADDYEPMAVIKRTTTLVPQIQSEWVEV